MAEKIPKTAVNRTDSDIEAAYNNQVAAASQAEAEAGTVTAIRRFTPERLKQAIKKLAKETIVIALAGKDTDHVEATNVNGLHIDFAFYVESVSLEFDPKWTDAIPTGSVFTVDINVSDKDGTNEASILSTKLSVNAGEPHSSTAATAAVISTNAIAQYKYINVDVDGIGSTLPGKGGFVKINGYRT